MAERNVQIVTKLFENMSNPEVVRELVAPDATYVSLNYSNPNLTKIMPWCGTHQNAGPDAISETFQKVGQFWKTEDYQIHATFGDEKNVAVYGQFTFRSTVMDKATTSPFNMWCRFDEQGLITYAQFMEDTLATSETFKKEGRVVYASDPAGGEIVVE